MANSADISVNGLHFTAPLAENLPAEHPRTSLRSIKLALLTCITISVGCLVFGGWANGQPYNHPKGEFEGWVGRGGIQVVTGQFDYDRPTDIALVRRESGWRTIPVAVSNGRSFQIDNRWAREDPRNPADGEFARDWARARGVQVVAGDFNNDRRTDIALVRRQPGWGSIPVALSTDDGFEIQNRPVNEPGLEFAEWAAAPSVQLITGDFGGGEGTDLALASQNAELGWTTVPVALSTTTGFSIQNRTVNFPTDRLFFADWAAAPGVQVIIGGFGGHSGTDIALVSQNPGLRWTTVPVAISTGRGFKVENGRVARLVEIG